MTVDLRFALDNFRIARLAWTAWVDVELQSANDGPTGEHSTATVGIAPPNINDAPATVFPDCANDTSYRTAA